MSGRSFLIIVRGRWAMRLVIFVALCALSFCSSHLLGGGEGLSAEALEMRDDVLSFLDNSQARGCFAVPAARCGELPSGGAPASEKTPLERGKIIGLHNKNTGELYFLLRAPGASDPLVLFSADQGQEICRYERMDAAGLADFFATCPALTVVNLPPLVRDLTAAEESRIMLQLLFLCCFSFDPCTSIHLLGGVFYPGFLAAPIASGERRRLRRFFLWAAPVVALAVRLQLGAERLFYESPGQVFLSTRDQISGCGPSFPRRKSMLKYFYGSLALSGALAWLGSYL